MKNSQIVNALEGRIGIAGPAVDIVETVAEVLVSNGIDPIEAASIAGQRREAIVALIDKRQEDAERRGLVHILEIYGTFRSLVGGSGRPHPNDDEKVQLAKRGRKNVTEILASIRALTPSEFEAFGSALVGSLGATVFEKTRQSGDQGIDFVGVARLGDLLDHPKKIFRLAHDMQIDFIGQAKHYPNRTIQASTVRELVGSLELARSRHFSSEKFELIEDLSLRSFSPVFSILITTGRVSAGARVVADKSGIIIRCGEQIATYLADLGVGIDAATDAFSHDLFMDWVAA